MAFSFANLYNTEIHFNINTEGFEYKTLEELYFSEDVVYPVRGLYINKKGLYGDSPLLATDEYYVNLPQHMLDTVLDILEDKRAVHSINEGSVGFSIYQYTQRRYNKTCSNIKWVDIDPRDYMMNEPIEETIG